MKPNVFLSHSKADKVFIEKVANDLRNARISVWYDEWEIPVGESFRKKIFDDGIPACDLFLVYLTDNSVNSFWVNRELDAAFIKDANSKGSSLAIFVDADEVRNKLPLDVQSLHSPVFNEENYNRPLNQLISRVWEVTLEKRIKMAVDSQRIQFLELEKEKNELQMQLLKLESVGSIDFDNLATQLKNIKYRFEKKEFNLLEYFTILSIEIASGATIGKLRNSLTKHLNILLFESDYRNNELQVKRIIGEIIIFGLITVQPATGEFYETYYLTEIGVKFKRYLINK